MKTAPLTAAAAVALLAAACGDEAKNPTKVWLALNGSERAVRLVPVEPYPF